MKLVVWFEVLFLMIEDGWIGIFVHLYSVGSGILDSLCIEVRRVCVGSHCRDVRRSGNTYLDSLHDM